MYACTTSLLLISTFLSGKSAEFQKFSEEMKMEAEATLIKKPIRQSRPPLLLTEVHERINKVSQSVAMTCMAV